MGCNRLDGTGNLMRTYKINEVLFKVALNQVNSSFCPDSPTSQVTQN